MAGESTDRTDSPGPEQCDAARRRHQAWLSALLLGMMVLAVLGAYLAGKLVQSHLESSRSPGRREVIFPGPATEPTWRPDGAKEAWSNPLAAVGLAPLDGDPHDVAPPPGATRRHAFRRRAADEVQQQAQYECAGTAEDVVAHYTRALEGKGFRRIKDGAGPTGRRTLVFSRGAVVATVGLRTNLEEAKMVTVVLTVAAPAARTPSQ